MSQFTQQMTAVCQKSAGKWIPEEIPLTPPADIEREKPTYSLPGFLPCGEGDRVCLPVAALEHSSLPHSGEWIHLVLPLLVLMLFYCQTVFKEKKQVSSAKPKGSTFDCKFGKRDNMGFLLSHGQIEFGSDASHHGSAAFQSRLLS